MHSPLSIFHPLVRRWFEERVGTPTAVQTQAWPAIQSEDHVLISAPTGTGKTLAAFLWALNQLITGAWPTGRTRVLYVSPLKALNNDVQRNLLTPLAQLRETFRDSAEALPEIQIHTRSGDTPSSERQRSLRRPPEIFITTPESLNILLSAQSGRNLFKHLKTVILDEVHAVADTKRGTHLITAVERLVPLAGEFQRVALSATINPLELIADFIGGYEVFELSGEPVYEKRPVTIIHAEEAKRIKVLVRKPEAAAEGFGPVGPPWPGVVSALKEMIRRNRSTLVFTNSRRLCERITVMLNEDEPEPIAYSHHGSLSREVRAVVEQRLKRGELAAIVATNSLELGIDIGALDEVALVQTPLSVASTLQRIGRAGHRVDAESRGVLLPTHARDYLDAAVVAAAVSRHEVEPLKPVERPLDVLAQVIVSMTAGETWDLDTLFSALRAAWPYQHLPRRQFDLVVDMLAGRYSESRIRELQPLVAMDRIDNTIRGLTGAARAIYLSGGTIADRGLFNLRRSDSHAKIGELDEEFVWERAVGDTFTLGTQCWRIQEITHNDVFVSPGTPGPSNVPFWRGEELNRSVFLSERIGLFLEQADSLAGHQELVDWLAGEHAMSEEAAQELADYLARQKIASGAPLPHRHHLLVEYVSDLIYGGENEQIVVHTLWGNALNKPFAVALAQAWEERYGHRVEVYSNNDCLALMTAHTVSTAQLMELVAPENIEPLLRKGLEKTGYFGARFRENAGIALQLGRRSFNKRMPLWFNRLRSKKLLDAVLRYADFPVLLETWRTCLQDSFDLPALRQRLDELRTGTTCVSEARTIEPTPFAASMVWRQTNSYMYADDSPLSGRSSRLRADVLAEAVHSAELRPRLKPVIVEQFQRKAQRLWPGYAPASPEDLLEWVKERLWLPEAEWEALLEASVRDAELSRDALLAPLGEKLARVTWQDGSRAGVIAVENLPRFNQAWAPPDSETALLAGGRAPAAAEKEQDANETRAPWLAEWLRFYGPIDVARLGVVLPAGPDVLAQSLAELAESDDVVVDVLTEGASEQQVCDAENLEILLRITRAAARPSFETLPAEVLPFFIAQQQGAAQRQDAGGLPDVLERLFAYPFPAQMIEAEVLPARIEAYKTAYLDGLFAETDLQWFGCGDKKIALGFAEHRELVAPERSTDNAAVPEDIFPNERGKYGFDELMEHADMSSASLTRLLWQMAWRGEVSNDSYAVLRKGILTAFRATEEHPQGRSGRRGFSRWRATRPFAGNWYRLPPVPPPEDALEEEERNRDRVRLLLDRYGVLFRELLDLELPEFQWGKLFRTLRLMELGGEIVSGSFFDGIAGLQFARARALPAVADEDAVFWLNATDPASLCGVNVQGLKETLPRRVSSTYIVYHGHRLVLVAQRQGKELSIHVPADAADLPRYLDVFAHLLTRSFDPMPNVTIETINSGPATKSAYLKVFRARFDVAVSPHSIALRRR